MLWWVWEKAMDDRDRQQRADLIAGIEARLAEVCPDLRSRRVWWETPHTELGMKRPLDCFADGGIGPISKAARVLGVPV